jgi:hypothetical protein
LHRRTEPRDGIADRLASIGIEIEYERGIAEAAENACDRSQRDDHDELTQFALLLRRTAILERHAGTGVPSGDSRVQLHSSFAGRPDAQGGRDGLLAPVPAENEP